MFNFKFTVVCILLTEFNSAIIVTHSNEYSLKTRTFIDENMQLSNGIVYNAVVSSKFNFSVMLRDYSACEITHSHPMKIVKTRRGTFAILKFT